MWYVGGRVKLKGELGSEISLRARARVKRGEVEVYLCVYMTGEAA